MRAPPRAPLVADIEFASGDALQIGLTDSRDAAHYDVSVIGSVRDRTLIVTHPQRAGSPLEVKEGAGVHARFFMRNQALGFRSNVVKVCTSPFPYLHLGFPSRLEPLQERKSARVRSALAATVRRNLGPSGEPETPGIIRDVSNMGAMLLTPVPVGVEGDELTLQFRLPLEQLGDHAVTIPATIKNSQDEADIPGSPWRHRYGVSFGIVESQATILLRAYLYERFAGA